MKFRLKDLTIVYNHAQLAALPDGKLLINTINAHSYNTARRDKLFAEALTKGDALIPDGVSIVKACRWLKAKSQPSERIAGYDLFAFEMARLESKISKQHNGQAQPSQCATQGLQGHLQPPAPPKATVMFMGSSEHVLTLIRKRMATEYPHLECVTYSPPYKPEFSEDDSQAIIDAINKANPDLLWIGMTAPKQEKWTYAHWQSLNIHCHVGTIGAVFDFFAGTVARAPLWWQRHGLEWLYRLLKEPRRMWRRYIIGNLLFVWNILVHE